MIAFASSLDQAGPLAQSAADCGWLLNAFAGFDVRDSTSLERADEDYTRYLGQTWQQDGTADKPLAGLRIGLPVEYFGAGLADDVRAAIDAALKQYQDWAPPGGSFPAQNRTVDSSLLRHRTAEASSNLSRFDGVRYGHRAEQYGICSTCIKVAGPGVRRRSQTAHPGRRLRAVAWILRRVLPAGAEDSPHHRAGFPAGVHSVDVIMGPVARPCVGSWRQDRRPGADVSGRHLYFVDQPGGLPGMSVPCGFAAPMSAVRWAADHRQLFQ